MEGSVQLKRWTTGLCLIFGIALLLALGGRWGLLVLAAAAVILAQWELARLLGGAGDRLRTGVCMAQAAFLPAAALWGGSQGLLGAVIGIVLLWMGLETVSRKELEGVGLELGRRMFSILYGGVLPCFFVLLWRLSDGIHWMLWTISVTALGDTAAYYVGSLWGRRKLMPRISPGKTVEGSLAGLAGNVAAGLLYSLLFLPQAAGIEGCLLSLGVGLVGQLGDLSESMLKRAAQVKDSGSILPGHGGILDRLDSLMFSAPVVFFWASR